MARPFQAFMLLLLLACSMASLAEEPRKIVFIAGPPSHPPGEHEHRAGCLLLKSCLDQGGGVTSVVYSNGWPQEQNTFDGADSIVIYADGGGGHPALQGDHLQILDALMKKGVGLVCIH